MSAKPERTIGYTVPRWMVWLVGSAIVVLMGGGATWAGWMTTKVAGMPDPISSDDVEEKIEKSIGEHAKTKHAGTVTDKEFAQAMQGVYRMLQGISEDIRELRSEVRSIPRRGD